MDDRLVVDYVVGETERVLAVGSVVLVDLQVILAYRPSGSVGTVVYCDAGGDGSLERGGVAQEVNILDSGIGPGQP